MRCLQCMGTSDAHTRKRATQNAFIADNIVMKWVEMNNAHLLQNHASNI